LSSALCVFPRRPVSASSCRERANITLSSGLPVSNLWCSFRLSQSLTKQDGSTPIKSLDYRDRGVSFVDRLDDDDFLIDLMERVRAFIDPDSTV
jgi:hypothetical protein